MNTVLNRFSPPNLSVGLDNEFQSILRNKDVNVVFQPILNLKEGETYGYEGLTRGPIDSIFHSPLKLLHFADKTGNLYLIEKLARELAINRSKTIIKNNEKLFINISSQVVYDPQFTPGHTMSLLKDLPLSPSDIVFEITERSSIKDFAAFKEVLNHYRYQGFKVAIDDAGAGYSSLQAISEIKPDYIKIDRSFITDVHQNEVKSQIVESFVHLAKKTESIVIAEGIETKEELEKVIELGIDCGQGFYLAKPQFPVTPMQDNLKKEILSLQNPQRKSIVVHIDDEVIFVKNNMVIKRELAKNLIN